MKSCIVFNCTNPESPVPVARFALDANGDGLLAYGKSYRALGNPLPLDPVHLPVSADTHRIPRQPDGSYGVISDAGPDAWGIRLTASISRVTKRPVPETPVDWLLHSWHYGAGCLGFSAEPGTPPRLGMEPQSTGQLSARLVKAIEMVATQADSDLDHEAIRLALPGGSLGGVRPKTVVLHEGREYIAKFSRQDDPFDVPKVEYATLMLAFRAGVRVPDFEHVEIGGRSVLLIERFDRTGSRKRIHYISANSLIGMGSVTDSDYKTRYSYAGIAEAMRGIDDHVVEDSHELFRRMVVNILVGNVDDHMRNHGILLSEKGKYRLSPAFDIVPHMDAASMPQSIGVGAFGRASTLENALSQRGRFQLSHNEAIAIIGKVRDVASGWRAIFREAGVSESDIRLLAPCFGVAEQADRLLFASAPHGKKEDGSAAAQASTERR
jgi:serine/threonine-protein kinase HipA